MKKIVFIGFDKREKIASDVCEYSLKKNSKIDLKISLLKTDELRKKKLYKREEDKLSSTEFTFTRFLVPYLMNYKGFAIFCDCDFLWLSDVSNLFKLVKKEYAVQCVKHEYNPKDLTKMDGRLQTIYPRKNWSSMVIWNCEHPSNKVVTPNLINSETGKFLHRFGWLKNSEIGSISNEWNWLVNWYKEPLDGKPKALHFTEGGPWFENHSKSEYDKLWFSYANEIKKK